MNAAVVSVVSWSTAAMVKRSYGGVRSSGDMYRQCLIRTNSQYRRFMRSESGAESTFAYAWRQLSAALMLRFPDPPRSCTLFGALERGGFATMLAEWRVTTDKVFGGCSEAHFEMLEDTDDGNDDGQNRFGRFSGVLSTRIGPGKTTLRRSGMCSVRSGIASGSYSMEDFDTLAMRVRRGRRSGDANGIDDKGRAEFIVNLRMENWVGPDARRDMMWQHFLRLPPPHENNDNRGHGDAMSGAWVDVRMPLDDFYLTYRGRLVENDTDMSERLESVSISVANTMSTIASASDAETHRSTTSNSSTATPSASMRGADDGNTTESSSMPPPSPLSMRDDSQDMPFCLDIRGIWLERQGLRRRTRGHPL